MYIAIAPCLTDSASTEKNESFNKVITSKHPKYKHYSGAEGLSYGVGLAALETTGGHGTVCDIMRGAQLSPGVHTKANAAREDSKKGQDREQHRSSTGYKARKKVLKDTGNMSKVVHERRKGTSY